MGLEQESMNLSSFSQPLHVLGDLLGSKIGEVRLFLFFKNFFFFFLLSLEAGAEIFFSYVKARCCPMEAPRSPASPD